MSKKSFSHIPAVLPELPHLAPWSCMRCNLGCLAALLWHWNQIGRLLFRPACCMIIVYSVGPLGKWHMCSKTYNSGQEIEWRRTGTRYEVSKQKSWPDKLHFNSLVLEWTPFDLYTACWQQWAVICELPREMPPILCVSSVLTHILYLGLPCFHGIPVHNFFHFCLCEHWKLWAFELIMWPCNSPWALSLE